MKLPVATYRLQLHDDFTLADAARIVPLLHRLGISHLYLSPISQATRGSEHGYDVTDPTRISEELGGADAMASLAVVLDEHGMGVLLDIVPNHMAASSENAWWADLLLNGTASEHARTFDTSIGTGAAARLELPVLGSPIDEIIETGELTLVERGGRRVLQYHDHWFPVPESAPHTERVTTEWLDSLPYILADWRIAQERIGYRRFFDITGLVGVCVEDPAVFQRTHEGILRWLANGWVDGLRIDHIDGLRDPAGYLRQLGDATSRARDGGRCYTVIEKILAPDENLPSEWASEGTTGYEMMRVASSFLVDPAGYRSLEGAFRRLSSETRTFGELVHACKLRVLDTLFAAELRSLAERTSELVESPVDVCTRVLRELTAGLDVYRTYIDADGPSATDRARIDAAHDVARQHLDARDHSTLDMIRTMLLLEGTAASHRAREQALDVVARWQQLSGPAMAKGFEDTALYRWPALLAVNDVGGEPGESLDVTDVHAFLTHRAEREPGALNATSTHDSKRSEDVRARLLVLSEHAEEWNAAVERWLSQMRRNRAPLAVRDELILLQTIVGAWPLTGEPDGDFVTRIQEYMRKAAREAKDETSWRQPDEEYERVLLAQVEQLLTSPELADVRNELRAFVERIALHGAVNSLAQMLLKCAAPGIPDTYQGTARWRFDLVDPDNRRPVDYEELAVFEAELGGIVAQPNAADVRALATSWRDGRLKLYVLMAALACRGRNRAFSGDYEPLTVSGTRAAHLLAFRRTSGDESVIALIPRSPARLAEPGEWPTGDVWGDTTVDVGAIHLRGVLDGQRLDTVDGRLRVADALAVLPVALLEAES